MLARVALIPAGVAPKDNADQDDLDRDTYNEEDLTTYQADLDRLAVAVDDEVPDLA